MSDNGPGLGWTIAKYTMYGVAALVAVTVVACVAIDMTPEERAEERQRRAREELRRELMQ